MALYYAADVSKCSTVLRGSDLEVGIQSLGQRVRREGNVWVLVDFDQNVTLSAVEYRFASRHLVHPFLSLLAALIHQPLSFSVPDAWDGALTVSFLRRI